MEEEISYIAKRYLKGKFSVEKSWRRLQIGPSAKIRRLRVAAAVASVIALSATGAIIYQQSTSHPAKEVQHPATRVVPPMEAVKVIDFEDAALPEVVSRIKEVYGVEISNLPENEGEYRLSLHYEGNVSDLVDAINDILGTQMVVKE